MNFQGHDTEDNRVQDRSFGLRSFGSPTIFCQLDFESETGAWVRLLVQKVNYESCKPAFISMCLEPRRSPGGIAKSFMGTFWASLLPPLAGPIHFFLSRSRIVWVSFDKTMHHFLLSIRENTCPCKRKGLNGGVVALTNHIISKLLWEQLSPQPLLNP